MIVELLVLSVAVVGAAALKVYANRPRVLTARANKAVVVTLKSGATFRGVLTASDSGVLVLKGTEALGDGSIPVDGELLLMRADVDYMQVP